VSKIKSKLKTSSNDLSAARDELSRAAVMLVMREPFFGHVLCSLQRHFTTSITTLAVALRGQAIQLVVNPNFFLDQLKNLEERTAVLKHEILHVVLNHLFRQQDSFDPRIWNIATDLVVNQYVRPFRLPDGAILLGTFPDMGLIPEDTAENYYEALHILRNCRNSKIPNGPTESPTSYENLEKIIHSDPPSDHSLWGYSPCEEIDGLPTGSQIPQHVREALKRINDDNLINAFNRTRNSHGAGSIPGWLRRQLDDLIYQRSAQIDWRSAIRAFSNSCRRSQLTPTLQRNSKRFEPVEGLPPVPGLKVKRAQSLIVAVDTSGSIEEKQLSEFFIEILALFRQGSEITIIEIDAQIQNIYKFRGIVPISMKGGGGTSFEPVMKWISTSPKKYDGCIFFTDGVADAPITNPGCKLLWVVAGGEGGDHLKFGRQIILS
jgi:predicted metal-dependent peptidase